MHAVVLLGRLHFNFGNVSSSKQNSLCMLEARSPVLCEGCSAYPALHVVNVVFVYWDPSYQPTYLGKAVTEQRPGDSGCDLAAIAEGAAAGPSGAGGPAANGAAGGDGKKKGKVVFAAGNRLLDKQNAGGNAAGEPGRPKKPEAPKPEVLRPAELTLP